MQCKKYISYLEGGARNTLTMLFAITLSLGLQTPQTYAETAQNASKTVTFKYIPSKLGIDYYALVAKTSPDEAGKRLAEMLSQGEAEWMKNAMPVFKGDTKSIWRDDFLLEVSSGAISDFTVDDLKRYTPNMLRLFAKLPVGHKYYGGLSATGIHFSLTSAFGKNQ